MVRAQTEKIQPMNDGAIHYSVRKAEKTDFACRNAKAKLGLGLGEGVWRMNIHWACRHRRLIISFTVA